MSSNYFTMAGADFDSIFHPGLNVYNRDDRLGFMTNTPNVNPDGNSLFRRYVKRGPAVTVDTGFLMDNVDLRNLLGGQVASEAVVTYFPSQVMITSFNPLTPAFYTLWLGPGIGDTHLAGHAEYPINDGNATTHDSWAIGSLSPSNAQVLITMTSDPNPNPNRSTPTIAGSTINSWIDLNELRSWNVENYQLGGYMVSYLRIRIRRKSDSVILIDTIIEIVTFHQNPDGGDPVVT